MDTGSYGLGAGIGNGLGLHRMVWRSRAWQQGMDKAGGPGLEEGFHAFPYGWGEGGINGWLGDHLGGWRDGWMDGRSLGSEFRVRVSSFFPGGVLHISGQSVELVCARPADCDVFGTSVGVLRFFSFFFLKGRHKGGGIDLLFRGARG